MGDGRSGPAPAVNGGPLAPTPACRRPIPAATAAATTAVAAREEAAEDCLLEADGGDQLVVAAPWARGARCGYGLGLQVEADRVVGLLHRPGPDSPLAMTHEERDREWEALTSLGSPLCPEAIYAAGPVELWQVPPMPCTLGTARAQLPADASPAACVGLGFWVLKSGAEQLARLEARRLVHGDVSPENFLVGAGGRLLLSDLNACLRLEADGGADWRALTPAFAAPELLAGPRLGPAADSWSLGMTALYATWAVPLLGPEAMGVNSAASWAAYERQLSHLCRLLPAVGGALEGGPCPAVLATAWWWPPLQAMAALWPRWARFLGGHVLDPEAHRRPTPSRIAAELAAWPEGRAWAAWGQGLLAAAARPRPEQAPTEARLRAYRQRLVGQRG